MHQRKGNAIILKVLEKKNKKNEMGYKDQMGS
jgi:hypothetical protein